MKNITTYILIAFIFSSFVGRSQDIGIGQWQDQLPYKKSQHIEKAGNLYYSMSDVSLYFYDIEDQSATRLSKVNGLSDSDFSTLAFHEQTNTMVIAYVNGNIDLLKDNEIINVSDIKRYPIIGDKRINGIMFIDNIAYLSCGFGIVLLDLSTYEIKDTYYIGDQGTQVNVKNMAFDGEKLYAATIEGIYYADYNNPILSYFESWTKEDRLPNSSATYSQIVHFGDKIITNADYPGNENDTVFVYNKNIEKWDVFDNIDPHINSIRVYDNRLAFTINTSVFVYDEDFQNLFTVGNPTGHPWSRYYDAIATSSGDVWYGCDYGMIHTWNDGTRGNEISLNGPYSSSVFSLTSSNNNLWVAPGAYKSDYSKTYNSDGVFNKNENDWINYRKTNTSAFDSINDVIVCAVHPTNPDLVYVGTWGGGVMVFENGEVKNVFDYSNSSLGEVNGWAGMTMISGLAFDSDENLWVANSNTSDLLSKYDNYGAWTSYNLGGEASTIDTREMVIDQEDQKWILNRAGTLICFNEDNNGASVNTRVLTHNSGHGALPGTKAFSVMVDRDGEIWVGSDEGVAVIYNPEDVLFNNRNYDAQRITVEWDGYVQYLLQTELISCMAINGYNEKWIGTQQSGIFKLSDDGTEQILHFTTENSPLFSNNIIDIAIDDNGTVYIGTDKGIISYRDEATNGGDKNSDVYAFPNPVPPDYAGTIGIKGLVEDAFVKITDIAGNLVYSTQAQGGQAVWNGYNFSGDRAQSGIYLVFVTNDDGTETTVTKILFLN